MFSTFGIFAIAFLESRLGFVGAAITETIVGIGASPRVASAPLLRILGIVAREWRERRHIDPSAIAGGWIGWACGVLFAVASLLGTISCDSLIAAHACGRSVIALLERACFAVCASVREAGQVIEAALMTVGRLICLGRAGLRECPAMVCHSECLGSV